MISFLKKVGRLGFFIALLVGFISSINWAYINYSKFFVLDTNVNVLILGDSHSKYAFNDRILESTYNFSKDGDSYFYSYLKLKEIKNNNPQIDTLLLSFSTHNIDQAIESRWLLNRSHLRDRLKFYYPIFEAEDFDFWLNQNPKELFTAFFAQVLNPMHFLLKGQSVYGGYAPLSHNILDKEIEKFKKKKQENEFSEATLEKKYLEKIKNYCDQNGIKLILINSPLHKLRAENQTDLYSFYESYFSDVLFLDFSKLEMTDDCFGDLVHLTPKGAEYFSSSIAEKGLLSFARSENAER